MFLSSLTKSSQVALDAFKLDGMMIRYSQFVPRLYNFCLSLGMEAGKIMPSRAFCSDESQGFPVILLGKHFGAFPFNHGMVGGIVSTNRHGPHAAHGEDLLIIQASHVGYEPDTKKFGIYRRVQTHDCRHSSNCGKIAGTIKWYLDEYHFACNNIYLEPLDGNLYQISINNLFLQADRDEGLMIDFDKLIAQDEAGDLKLTRSLSTARRFNASEKLIELVGENWPTEQKLPIGTFLAPELFSFQRHFLETSEEGIEHLEKILLEFMPWVVTHPEPTLAAAQFTTQVEFDRAYRSILNEASYKNRNLLFISGLNIDISPNKERQTFPLTKFVPWAAYVQKSDGTQFVMEQQELYDTLFKFEMSNDREINLEKEIDNMEHAKEVQISYDFLNKK